MAKRQTKADKALDKEIERLYHLHAMGRQIDILDITKVFGAARAAHAQGLSMEEAVKAAVTQWTFVAGERH